MASHNYEDKLANFLGATLAGLIVLALIVLAWIIVKCVETVVWAVTLHPRCRPLQVALGAFLVFLTLMLLFGAARPVLVSLWLVSTLALVLVAKIALIYYDTLFQRELDRPTLTERVLHEPWWSTQPANHAASHQLAA